MLMLFYIDYLLLVYNFWDNFDNVRSFEDLVAHEYFSVLCIIIAVHILIIGCSAIGSILSYLMPRIPIYIMAHNSGYAKPWLVFVPYGNTYVSYILPVVEYSYLGWFKTYNRQTVFWVYFAADFFQGIFAFVFGNIPLFGVLLQYAYIIGKKLMHFGEYRDLLRLYKCKNSAEWIAGIGIVCPLVYWITLFIVCRNEPEFGFDNFYNPAYAEE